VHAPWPSNSNDADLAIIDKRRPKANEAQVMHIIGEVKDRDLLIVDDMVDTAGTLCKAAAALKEHGAKRRVAYCTHPVLSGPAIDNIINSCSMNWWSPTPFRCPSAPRPAADPPGVAWRQCWQKPCAVSATKNPSARCSSVGPLSGH
jgi:hypothetical protein